MICVLVEKDVKTLRGFTYIQYESEGYLVEGKDDLYYPLHKLNKILKKADVKLFEFRDYKEFTNIMDSLFGSIHWYQDERSAFDSTNESWNELYGTGIDIKNRRIYEFYAFNPDISSLDEIRLSALPSLIIDAEFGC